MRENVGFIGLGLMGGGMALNILKSGHKLTVYNRTRSKASEIVRQGALWADSPSAAAARSTVIITMVSDPAALKEVILGQKGVLAGAASGSVIIDMSTVDPDTTQQIADEAAKKGIDYLDCPVTGSKVGAADGTLTLMCGGEKDVLERCRPVLMVMGKKLIHAGPTGMGSYMKLFNNLLLAGCYEAFSEAMVFGVKAGLKTDQMMELIQSGFMACKFFDFKGASVLKRDFSQNFSTALMHKDIGLILAMAKKMKLELPGAAVTNEIFNIAESKGLAREDFCSVIKVHEEKAGVIVKK